VVDPISSAAALPFTGFNVGCGVVFFLAMKIPLEKCQQERLNYAKSSSS